MITSDRHMMEEQVLRQHLPTNTFRFMDMQTSNPYIVMAVKTRNAKIYTIRINLDKFPMEIPKAFVTKMLYKKNGEKLDSPSHYMHTLSSENGWTRICHYDESEWTPQVSLYLVYLKCKLWLDMYEAHLVTGTDICDYLTQTA